MAGSESDSFTSKPRASPPAAVMGAQQAYELTLPELSRLDASEVRRLNLSVPAVVAIALAAAKKLEPHRSRIVALPEIDHALIASLRRYTLALAHAEALFGARVDTRRKLRALVDRARKTRRLLREEVRHLGRHGLLDASVLNANASGRGFHHVAFELLALCGLFRERWEQLKGRALVSVEQLDEAEALADSILRALGKEAKQRTETAETRDRAFTLFVRAYDEARRALTYLFWGTGEADVIAPSLFASLRR